MLLAHLQVDGAGAHGVARGNAQRERRPGRHDDRGRLARLGPAAEQPAVEDVHALGDHEGLWREAVVGQGVVAREGPDASRVVALSQARAQVVEQGVCRLGGLREEEDGRVAVGVDETSTDERRRGAAQARETHGSPAPGHLGDDALEGVARRLSPVSPAGHEVTLRTHESPNAPRGGGGRPGGPPGRSSGEGSSRSGRVPRGSEP